mmetsp:Transcript_74019/g.176187  ORF Transcript_74019/g.176187 Transcript_74019/m.176187 type:complete len:369 (-) Transcript_74019:13-1119(-)
MPRKDASIAIAAVAASGVALSVWLWIQRRQKKRHDHGKLPGATSAAAAATCQRHWVEIGTAPWSKRHDFCAAPFRDGLVVLGGYSGRRHNDCWWSADGLQWTCLNADESVAWQRRMKHSIVASAEGVYLLGGEGPGWRALNDVWHLSAANGTWKMLKQAASWAPRSCGAAVLFEEDVLLVLGGASGRKLLDTIWMGSLSSLDDAKSKSSKAPWGARRGMAAVALPSSRALVMAGRDSSGTPHNDVWYFCDGEWFSLGNAPWSQRCSAATCCIPSAEGSSLVVFCGGLGAGGALLSDMWSLSVPLNATADSLRASLWKCECEVAPWSARAGHAVAWAAAAGRLLLMGGVTLEGSPLNDVWAWEPKLDIG